MKKNLSQNQQKFSTPFSISENIFKKVRDFLRNFSEDFPRSFFQKFSDSFPLKIFIEFSKNFLQKISPRLPSVFPQKFSQVFSRISRPKTPPTPAIFFSKLFAAQTATSFFPLDVLTQNFCWIFFPVFRSSFFQKPSTKTPPNFFQNPPPKLFQKSFLIFFAKLPTKHFFKTFSSILPQNPTKPRRILFWIFITALFFTAPALTHSQQLRVTEILADGHDERIEISNLSAQNFSGELRISGAKSAEISLESVAIGAGESRIFGDFHDAISWNISARHEDLGFSLGDSSAISLQIFSSGMLLDQVSIDTGLVFAADSAKSSLHRFSALDQRSGTTTDFSTGTSGLLANPWRVFADFSSDFSPAPSDDDEPSVEFDLLLTEVFFEGYDERIEIFNRGSTDFSGTLEISTLAQTKTFPAQIPAGEFFLIGDEFSQISPTLFSQFSGQSAIITGAGRVINDDGNISISLNFSGGSDIFDVEEDRVFPFIDGNNSFEKVRFQWDLKILAATGDRSTGVQSGFFASPGFIPTVTESQFSTGDFLDEDFADEICPTNPPLKISEIFLWNSSHPAFIELLATTTVSGDFVLTGSALNRQLDITLSSASGDRILVVSQNQNYRADQVFSLSSFLGSGTRIELVWQTGQVFDTVDIVISTPTTDNQSLYFSQKLGCTRVFNLTGSFSPGFDEYFLQFAAGSTQVVIQRVGGGGGSSCQVPLPSQTSEKNSENPEKKSPETSPENQKFAVEIVDLKFTGDESLTLKNFTNSPLDLADFRLGVSSRSSATRISGLLGTGDPQIFTGNFRLLDDGACARIFPPDRSGQSAEFCRPQNFTEKSWENTDFPQTSPPVDTETPTETSSTPGEIRFSDNFSLAITAIDFDPEGADADRESIGISTEFSGISIADFDLLIGDRRSKILENFTGTFGTATTLTGNFRFPNSRAVCVSIQHRSSEQILDSHCYDPELSQTSPQKKSIPDFDARIESLIFDPEWPDTDRESITIFLDSPESLPADALHLRVGTRRANFDTGFQPGQNRHIETFRFPNSRATCVTLVRSHDEALLDTRCYDPTQIAPPEKLSENWENWAWEKSNSTPDENPSAAARYDAHDLQILAINFDPLGPDTDRESITFFAQPSVDFSDDFFLRIDDRRRRLTAFTGSQSSRFTLTGNFWFPNSRDTCVTLERGDQIFSEFCYKISSKSSDDREKSPEKSTGTDFDQNPPQVSIVALIPNAFGRDTDRETIALQLHSRETLDLSQLSLQVDSSRRKISGFLLPGPAQRFTGNFRLPNRAACVDLTRNSQILDTFCYPDPDEGIEFRESVTGILALEPRDLSLLTQIRLTRRADQICSVFRDTTLACRKIPTRSVRSSTDELRLHKNYIDLLHETMLRDRSVLLSETELGKLKFLFDQARSALREGQTTLDFFGNSVTTSDLATQRDIAQTATDREIFLPFLDETTRISLEEFLQNF